MRIEVVYALASAQEIVVLELAGGSVAGQALAASGLIERHALLVSDLQLGIFGKRVAPAQTLREGDRVEILRALTADPNEARRGRARRTRGRRSGT
ncbi:MAG: RnfH family protein [Betaproteobacteria bacterium]|nr:RnfH family protein [Betaproteobacteria bacterium]